MRTKTFLVVFAFVGILSAQKAGRSYNMFWGGYYNYIQVNSKWNINSDIQHRTRDGFETQSQSLIRTAAVYKINKVLTASGGGAHFRYYITNELTRGEWRPWQEIGASNGFGKFKISNRVRVEERFNQVAVKNVITDEYRFNWRFRYKVDLEFPLPHQGTHPSSFGLGNEFMANAGKIIKYPFDQNRTLFSYNYQVTRNVKLQLQYIYIVQYIASTDAIDKVSVFRINIHHTIKL
jgi:hypothetical protein